MARIAIQLYSLRSLGESTPRLVRRVAETAFEGVEFTGLGDAAVSEVAEALEETDTAVAGAHVGIDSLEAALDETRTRYALVGCDRLVVPRLDEVHFETEASVRAAARRLNDIAGTLAEWDVDLCYHNHDHEFACLETGPAFDVLVEAIDDEVGVELDVGWATAAGVDPVEVLDRLEGRVPLVHLKDVDADGAPVELGEGVVDLEACIAAAVDAGAEWMVYEHDDPVNPEGSLIHGANTLAALRDGVSQ